MLLSLMEGVKNNIQIQIISPNFETPSRLCSLDILDLLSSSSRYDINDWHLLHTHIFPELRIQKADWALRDLPHLLLTDLSDGVLDPVVLHPWAAQTHICHLTQTLGDSEQWTVQPDFVMEMVRAGRHSWSQRESLMNVVVSDWSELATYG